MIREHTVHYAALAADAGVTDATWDAFADDVLVPRWIAAYRATTEWQPDVVAVQVGALTYLFDAAPTMRAVGGPAATDRVVAVWGRSAHPTRTRDRARMAGFLAERMLWSARGRDRGHLVAHTAGGALDLNLFPQTGSINRGRTAEGCRWRAFERLVAERPGTALFVRPSYRDAGWVPATVEFGRLTAGDLHVDRVANEPG